jgi:myo-inositol 2-dehydrogenase/D-chiro-inositol 1-dehydrogenase
MKNKNYKITRREFVKTSVAATTVGFAAPYIVPSSVFGADAPSGRINVGCIGVGRMGLGDITDIHGFKDIQIVAVCDVDSKRAAYAKQFVEDKYAAQSQSGTYKGCTSYGDYRQLLERKDIDAVMICTPDHWHVLPAIAAAKAGKDIFLQKPLSLTIEEGRALSGAVKKYSTVFIVGSQQRSDARFRFACELVRNGRIGKLQTVKVGFGLDPGTTPQPPMPVPENLNYDMWLGPAPNAAYTEKRVHPQEGYGRPGWLRIRDYGWGMITGWGSHHMDIAHWGIGSEYTGHVEIKGWAEFPKEGLWDVHGDFSVEYKYANGVNLICAGNSRNKQGILFEGSEGWVYVRRGFIDAQPKLLLTSKIGPDEIHLYKSDHHKGNFIQCIKSRSETVAPVEVAHRSCSACILGGIAMLLPRKLKWNPTTEKFIDDPEADRMISRPMRSPWSL